MSTTQMFDELAKRVATVTSRRQVFKVLAGGAVAAVTGTLLGSRSAESAEVHTCCVYACPDGSFAHRFIKGVVICPDRTDSKFPCSFFASETTKCSDCGSFFGN